MEMDNLFSRFFAHYGLHLHTKRDFFFIKKGMECGFSRGQLLMALLL